VYIRTPKKASMHSRVRDKQLSGLMQRDELDASITGIDVMNVLSNEME